MKNQWKIFIILFFGFSHQTWSDNPDYFSPKAGFAKELEETRNSIVLTFDDGPLLETTPVILQTLEDFNSFLPTPVRATFFLSGKSLVENYEVDSMGYIKKPGTENLKSIELVEKIIKAGHFIGNHGFTHSRMGSPYLDHHKNLKISISELMEVHKVIERFLTPNDDLNHHWFFRAPYGNWKESRAEDYNSHEELKQYIGPIFWDIGGEVKFSEKGTPIDAADWNCSHHQKLQTLCHNQFSKMDLQECLVWQCARGYLNSSYLKVNFKGGIVLLHDIQELTTHMLPYVLRVWSGVNPYMDKDPELGKKLESFVKTFRFENAQVFSFKNLNQIQYFKSYDSRLIDQPPVE
ncbi:MAG: polysaccharide deacetylase family protein [Bacteriovoracaceae bacterium]|nr:polysaccharide deacetylase family protein [Bacteriovoracaceae bacterium]